MARQNSGNRPNSRKHSTDAFSPLESALEEAISYHFKKASAANKDLTALTNSEDAENEGKRSQAYQALRSKYRAAATEQMRHYKLYTQELSVLESRRGIAGAMPALFRWETVKTSTPVENTHLAEDQMELMVNYATDMEVLLSGHNYRSISIKYNIGIPRDNPVTGSVPAAKYVDGTGATWSFKTIIPFKRTRSIRNLLERKKIMFEFILHKGMFHGGDITIGMVALPLVDLLTKTSAGGDALPLTKEGRGRGIGGVLSAYAQLRTPVDGPEVKITEERHLVVEKWPDISVGPAVAPKDSVIVPPANVASSTNKVSQSEVVESPPPPVDTDKFRSDLTEKEINDPFNADFLLSNDVMDDELETLKTDLASCSDPDEQFNLNFRHQIVERNMNILVLKVQNESLSLEAYIESIKERLKRDQKMALYFKNTGDTSTALKLMKRIKIMTDEVKNAEGA